MNFDVEAFKVSNNIKKQKNDPMAAKVGLELASVYNQYMAVEALQEGYSMLPIYGDEVAIDFVATDDADALLTDLEELGLKQGSVYGRVVSGMLPIEAIPSAASSEYLKFARPAMAMTNVGLVTSEADIAMGADVARSNFNVDGTGVTVGVLSDSFDNLGGAADDVASGDLPGLGNPLDNTIPINVLEELPGGGIDEGRAMIQLVHDIAPGAELAFHTAFLGEADFANGIIELAEQAGSEVIVDDIIYFAEPMFQDGIIAQAVDQVVAEGVSYFSSAGNNARNSYESTFNPSNQFEPTFGGEFHDFDPGAEVDVLQSITVPVGAEFIISFQWDSPFFSVSGGTGSPNDLDIFVFDESGTNVLTGSAAPNTGNDPVEIFQFVNDGSFGTDQFNLAISNFAGADPDLMKYVLFESGGVTINEFDTNSSTVYGHANAAGAEAVGAAFYQDTPEFGVNPAQLEDFSAAGPTPILFDENGNRLLDPEVRQKPEIVAPDGTNNTFFPPFPGADVEGDGFPNFFGTSAAAPHAAAVAALMLDAAPGTTPADIYETLESTALDMDDPFTPGFDVGFDDASGFGLIQADEAIEELIGSATDEPNDTISQAIATNLSSANPGSILLSGVIGNNPNIPPTSDVDIYELQLEAGDRVTIDIDANEFASSLDSILRLFDSNGNEVAVSDDTPAPGEPFSLDSYIDFSAPITDNYYVGVSSFANFGYSPLIAGSGDGFSTGAYDINIAIGLTGDENGGFETGDFTAWENIGDTSIQTAEFGTVPTQGNFQALLTTGAGSVSDTTLENFLGLNFGDIDNISNEDATEGSALQRTITVEAGDILSFDFNFLTNEGTPTFFNDFGFVSIIPNSLSELADTNNFFVLSPTEFFEETDYNNFTFEFSEAGTYTVGIGVVDLIDNIVDSGLLVDDFKIVSEDEAILGTNNDEFLFGEVSDDTIYGKGGNDQIFGSEGVNNLYGGAGNDTIYSGSQADTIYGGAGDDTIFASEGDNIVFGGLGDDTIYTGSGNDKIVGGFGNDIIWLSGGQDIVVLEAGKGTDTINNFQLGQTTFDISGNPNDLSIVNGINGAEISQFGELLAVVSWNSASTLVDNIDTVFV
ncbi:MAG: pre-peptidase C-terminal domain-containing protein [Calothrix sp. MO_167.B42]|nr:pre-peptidase C-terminal domain-containing protein [Calothrix sp. MO_167.B42]